jgi:hypothetical protein
MVLKDFEMTAFSKVTENLKKQYKLYNWTVNMLSYVDCPSVTQRFRSASNNGISIVKEESTYSISVPNVLRVIKIDILDVLHIASKLCYSEFQFQ